MQEKQNITYNTYHIYNAEQDVSKLHRLEDITDYLIDTLESNEFYINKNYAMCLDELKQIIVHIISIALEKINVLKTGLEADNASIKNIIKDIKISDTSQKILLGKKIMDLEVRIKESQKFLALFPVEKQMISLRNIIIDDSIQITLKQKHKDLFLKIPELMEGDFKIFEIFFATYNQFLKNKIDIENQLKLEKEKQFTKTFDNTSSDVVPNCIEEEYLSNDEYLSNGEFILTDCEEQEHIFIPCPQAELLLKNIYSGNALKDLISFLPSINKRNYYNIRNNIMKTFSEEINFYQEFLEECNEHQKVLNILEEAYISLEEYFFNLENNNDEVISNENAPKNNIYFSKRMSGERYFDFDINTSQFRNEFSKKNAKNLLIKLYNGSSSYCLKHAKKLNKNDDLIGVYELKSSDVRLVYMHICDNNYYVIMTGVKKSNNAYYDIDRIKRRLKTCYNDYLKLKNK